MSTILSRPRLLVPFLLALAAHCSADVTVALNPSADAFITSGSADPNAGFPTFNYGAAGSLMVAAPGSTKGEMQSLLKFDLTSAKSTFDASFGAGNWMVNSVILQLGTNFGTQGAQPSNLVFNSINGGSFKIDWLANDNWAEGTGTPMSNTIPSNPPVDGLTFNSLSTLLSGADTTLGTFTYTPVGNTNPPTIPLATYTLGLPTSFLTDLSAGNNVSLRAYAGDNGVGYLFNSKNMASNKPVLNVTAVAAPEPASAAFLGGAALLCLCGRRRHAQVD